MKRIFTFFPFLYKSSLGYLAPSNLSYFWNFGSLALFALALQLVTGLCLSWWYIPHIDLAFSSVEFIMREVLNGWMIRYAHANGASFFFLCVYIHMARSLYYGSYQSPRVLVWLSGLAIFFLMILTAFLGYVLPWGQMSYWAATVITSLTTVVPFLGNIILSLIWGGFGLGQQTLTRFYSFHFVLPFVLLFLIAAHMLFLHETGSSDPIFDNQIGNDKISFHPYYTYKDILGIFVFLVFFFCFVFFAPNTLGHPLNYIQANPGVTPVHIVPEWYFLPFYGILRAIPSKLFGVIAMMCSIFILAILPFLNQTLIKNSSYRPIYKCIIWFLFITFLMLGWIGYHVLEYPFIELSRLFCFFYFFIFLVFPLVAYLEKSSL